MLAPYANGDPVSAVDSISSKALVTTELLVRNHVFILGCALVSSIPDAAKTFWNSRDYLSDNATKALNECKETMGIVNAYANKFIIPCIFLVATYSLCADIHW